MIFSDFLIFKWFFKEFFIEILTLIRLISLNKFLKKNKSLQNYLKQMIYIIYWFLVIFLF